MYVAPDARGTRTPASQAAVRPPSAATTTVVRTTNDDDEPADHDCAAAVVGVVPGPLSRATETRYAVINQPPVGPGANVNSFVRWRVSGPVPVVPLTSRLKVVATSSTAPFPSARPSNRTGVAVTVGEVVTGVIPSSVSAARSTPVAAAATPASKSAA